MKTLILSLLLIFFYALSFGQSVLISPSRITNVSDDGDNLTFRSNSDLIGIQGQRFNGTLLAKTPLVNGDDLLRLAGGGVYEPNNFTYDKALIRFTTTQNWSTTARGTKMTFSTTPNNATNFVERMVIDNAGKVGIGVSIPSSNLTINEKTVGNGSSIQLTNADAGISASDGLHINMGASSLFFSYSASIMNKENSYFSLGTNNNSGQLVLEPSGNVGVGSQLALDAKLTVEANSTCCLGTPYSTLTLKENEADGARLRFTNTNTTSNANFWDVFGLSAGTGSQANATLSYYYATGSGTGNNVMSLKGNGNVGLGIDTPADQLHVNAISGTGDAYARISSTSGLTGLRLQNLAGDWSMYSNEFNELFWGYSSNNFASNTAVIKMAPNGVTNFNLNPTGNDIVFLGSSGTRWKEVFSVLPLNVSSDRRLKKNIKAVDYGLSEILKLKPVSYNWKNSDNAKTYLGFLAQEVEAVVPEVVTKSGLSDAEFEKQAKSGKLPTDTYGMDYTGLIPVLVKAIQEQQAQLQIKSSQINALEARLSALEQNLESTKTIKSDK